MMPLPVQTENSGVLSGDSDGALTNGTPRPCAGQATVSRTSPAVTQTPKRLVEAAHNALAPEQFGDLENARRRGAARQRNTQWVNHFARAHPLLLAIGT